jgi:catechol 2,3-dioxygenase-like lactoylglutathione lyase family enzyme
MPLKKIACLSLLVPDYDEAIEYYTRVLGFELIEDTDQGGGSRWVTVAPSRENETALCLVRAATPIEKQAIGAQCGGRVLLIYHTDDFTRDYTRMQAAGVEFEEEPRHELYGNVAVFRDRYGNRWDLLEPRENYSL